MSLPLCLTSFNQTAFLCRGNSVSNKSRMRRRRRRAAPRERSMCEREPRAHEWKPPLTMVRHEMSCALHAPRGCLVVSQSAVSGIIAMIRKKTPFVQTREWSLLGSFGSEGGREARTDESDGITRVITLLFFSPVFLSLSCLFRSPSLTLSLSASFSSSAPPSLTRPLSLSIVSFSLSPTVTVHTQKRKLQTLKSEWSDSCRLSDSSPRGAFHWHSDFARW